MRFENYIYESSTASATQMEMAIVQKWNNERLTKPQFEEAAGKIVDELKNNYHLTGKADHMGSGSFPLSDIWKKYGGTDTTPKTDLKIGNKKVSLKKAGGSQLMSGKKGESRATFFSVVNTYDPNIGEDVIKQVEDYFNKFIVSGKNKMNITQQKKSGSVSMDIIEAEKMHKEFTKYLENLFNTDSRMRDGFIYEAMSGKIKFDDKDGTADHMLVFDPNGGVKKWNSIDESFAKKIATKTKINISWKSTSSKSKSGKYYNYFSVVRLLNGKVKNEMSIYNGEILTEGIIKNIWDKIKDWFVKLWKTISNWLREGIDNLLSFLGLEPELHMGVSIL